MSEAALAVIEGGTLEQPSALMRRAVNAAAACKEIVTRTAIELNKKKYVPVEGWASIAAVYGCTPSIREVIEEDRGIKAIAELKTHDGRIVASAEGYCGLDEPMWANRALYARRGMAQTRAVSRVCRTAFAFVVTLMDAGLQTTPAEEIPHGPEPVVEHAGAAPTPGNPAAPERSKATQVRFGKSKGKHLCDIEENDLRWQLAAARKSVEAADPKWDAQNRAWLSTVEAEASRRGLV